jgi:hypothetical protein
MYLYIQNKKDSEQITCLNPKVNQRLNIRSSLILKVKSKFNKFNTRKNMLINKFLSIKIKNKIKVNRKIKIKILN